MVQNLDIVERRQIEVDGAIENKNYNQAKKLIKEEIQIAEKKTIPAPFPNGRKPIQKKNGSQSLNNTFKKQRNTSPKNNGKEG